MGKKVGLLRGTTDGGKTWKFISGLATTGKATRSCPHHPVSDREFADGDPLPRLLESLD